MKTSDSLADLIGQVAAGEFNAALDSQKPQLLEWVHSLRAMTDTEFAEECRSAIYGSASVVGFRGNFEADHCKASACFHESTRRLVLAGHADDCRGPSIYGRAHASLMLDHGYTPTPVGTCECDISA